VLTFGIGNFLNKVPEIADEPIEVAIVDPPIQDLKPKQEESTGGLGTGSEGGSLRVVVALVAVVRRAVMHLRLQISLQWLLRSLPLYHRLLLQNSPNQLQLRYRNLLRQTRSSFNSKNQFTFLSQLCHLSQPK
jgi:hypothetical protein